MNAKEIMDIRSSYIDLKCKLRTTYKALPIVETFNHMSGKKVKATAKVKAYFDLDSYYGIYQVAIISTIEKDLENNWLKLHKQSSYQYKSISLEEFLNLEDWEDSKESLVCTIIE